MNEDEERDFWSDHDSTDFVDWNSAEKVTLAKLKPSTRKFLCGCRKSSFGLRDLFPH